MLAAPEARNDQSNHPQGIAGMHLFAKLDGGGRCSVDQSSTSSLAARRCRSLCALTGVSRGDDADSPGRTPGGGRRRAVSPRGLLLLGLWRG